MKKYNSYHDDPPCYAKLNPDGFCPECNLYPDMQSIALKEIKLQDLLSTMDIPTQRKTDFRWLQRNLAIRNGNHSSFKLAMEMIKEEIKNEN